MAFKRIYLRAAALSATLALAACGDTPIETKQSPINRQIGFEFREEKSRAQSISIDNIENIGVYGYFTGYERWGWMSANNAAELKPDYFCNTLLLKDEGWTYSPVRYWPMEPAKRISFFAYSPWSDGETAGTECIVPYPLENTDAGVPYLKYTVPTNIKNQIDLLWGCVQDKNIENPQVAFTMNHALAALTFSVKYATEEESEKGYGVNVTGITVSGVYGSGILDLATGAWKFDTDAQPVPSDQYTMSASDVNVIVPASVAEPHLKSETFESRQLLTDDAGMLMTIPQDLGNGVLTFLLDFIATDKTITPTLISFELTDSFKSWQAGKRYHYELLVTGDFITVETSVGSIWQKSGNETSGNVIL